MPQIRLDERRAGGRAAVATLVATALFAVLAFVAATRGPILFDDAVSSWLHADPSSPLAAAARSIAKVASPQGELAAAAILAAAVLAASRSIRWTIICALGPALTAIAVVALKHLVARPPAGATVLSPSGEGLYPSGHSAGITALAGALTLVVLAARPSPRSRKMTAAVASAAILVVGASLVLARDHYPTDVAGGILLAVSATGAVRWAVMASARNTPRRETLEPPAETSGGEAEHPQGPG